MENDSGRTSTQYFGTLPPNRLISELIGRTQDFDDFVRQSGRYSLWYRSYVSYNKGIYKDARLNRVGEQAEYTELYVNHFRNLLNHISTLITNQRPAFEARAANTDYSSQTQTKVANGILEYYNRSKGMDSYTKNLVEDVNVFGDAYLFMGWDDSLGDPYMANPNEPLKAIKQGDIRFKNYTPIDVIFDFVAGLNSADRQWYILREYVNKWDLVEKYPQFRDKILKQSYSLSDLKGDMKIGYKWNNQSDLVPFFTFIHERTNSLPNGRYFTFCGKDCWFVDSGLPPFYKELPIYRLTPSEQRGTGFGYTVAYDLLPIQEMLDGLHSIVSTNISTFGVQNILVPLGSPITVTEIADGLNMIQYDPKLGIPQPLQLLATSREVYDFMVKLEQTMEVISGINSVARGTPEANLKSGTALALVQSMAIQFVSGLQQEYVKVLEKIGTGMINILKANATTPRMIEIAGRTNRSYTREFTGKDISGIDRVTIDIGNPLSRTIAGKVNIAENLLQAGMIENPQQYLQVLTTGKLETMIEGKQSELMMIKSENEGMTEGRAVPVIITDDHQLHCTEHKSLLSSVEARSSPRIVEIVLAHIQQHKNLWQTMDPVLAAMVKIVPSPIMAPPTGVPTGGTAPGIPAEGTAEMLTPETPIEQKAGEVRPPNMPDLPVNMLTGEEVGGATQVAPPIA